MAISFVVLNNALSMPMINYKYTSSHFRMHPYTRHHFTTCICLDRTSYRSCTLLSRCLHDPCWTSKFLFRVEDYSGTIQYNMMSQPTNKFLCHWTYSWHSCLSIYLRSETSAYLDHIWVHFRNLPRTYRYLQWLPYRIRVFYPPSTIPHKWVHWTLSKFHGHVSTLYSIVRCRHH